ncbi:MAG: hypothetical protein HY454_00175 [Parcubacteria group bacterium]|nr:hypothetical protein [Parcubacteria group bacterium]
MPLVSLALEVDFPSIAGQAPTDSFGPAQWISYIFVFSLAVVGLAIIYALVRAGFLWMTAGDNSGKITEARDWIKGAVIGLVILVGSVTFLRMINPQLVTLKNPQIKIIGTLDYWKALFTGGSSTKFCTYFSKCKEGEGECVNQAGEIVNEPGEFGICDAEAVGVPQYQLVRETKIGSACFGHLECESGFCSGFTAAPPRSGTCQNPPFDRPALKQNGEVCENHNVCQSGVCNGYVGYPFKTGICADRSVLKADGENCTKNDVCQSGFCAGFNAYPYTVGACAERPAT